MSAMSTITGNIHQGDWFNHTWEAFDGITVVYVLRFPDRQYKIGTTKRLQVRLGQNYGKHGPFILMAILPGSYDVEFELHDRFASSMDKKAERFGETPELLAFIKWANSTTFDWSTP